MEANEQPSSSQLDLARGAFGRKEFAEALRLADEVLNDEPENAGALIVRAGALGQLGRRDEFEEALARAIDLDSQQSWPFAMKSIVLVERNEDIPEAVLAAERATELSGEDAVAWDALAGALIASERYSEAAGAAQKAVDLAGDEAGYWRTLGRATFYGEEFARANDAYGQVLDQEPESVSALAMKAATLIMLDQYGEAKEIVDRAYELDSKQPMVLRIRGALSALMEEFDQAEATFREWTVTMPDDPDPWIGLGMLFIGQAKPEQALDALEHARELDEENTTVQTLLATAYMEAGEGAHALAIFTRLVQENPTLEEAWLGKSGAERDLGLTEHAIDSARSALSQSSFKSRAAWIELARAYSVSGKHQNSWQAYSEAARVDPEDVDAAIGLAVESLSCHNEARALSELAEAEERVGSHALIEFNRGVAHYKLGRQSQALAAWRRAHDLDPQLTVAEVLVESYATESKVGGWVEHWFGDTGAWDRMIAGGLLVVALVFFLILPTLRPGLICWLETGNASVEAYIPAIILALLLILPTIRGLAVGGVSLDVSPLSAPDQPFKLDPDQIIPMAAPDELDVARLIVR